MKNIKRCHDLTGQKFGRLTVVGLDDKNTRKTYWICQCECGGIKSARSDSLLCGAIKSCGCMKKEQDRINLEANHSHKQSGTRINNRNTNIYITIGNETKTLLYWCNMFKIDYRTVLARYWRNPNVTLDELFKANTEVTDRPSAP